MLSLFPYPDTVCAPCYTACMKRKVRKEEVIGFETRFTPDPSGGYVVTVPLLPGLATEGATLTEARRMAKEAILCYVEGVLKEPGRRSSAVVHA